MRSIHRGRPEHFRADLEWVGRLAETILSKLASYPAIEADRIKALILQESARTLPENLVSAPNRKFRPLADGPPIRAKSAISAESPSEDRTPGTEPPPKEPSEEAIQCYRLIVLRGDLTSQRSIAKQVYGDESKQYQVSRDLKVVKKWIKAGNVLPDLDSPRPKIYPVDPAKLNRGARPEGSYARRKHR